MRLDVVKFREPWRPERYLNEPPWPHIGQEMGDLCNAISQVGFLDTWTEPSWQMERQEVRLWT